MAAKGRRSQSPDGALWSAQLATTIPTKERRSVGRNVVHEVFVRRRMAT